MAVRLVVGQPPPQVAMQRDGVQERLQRVVAVVDLGDQRSRPVVPTVSASPGAASQLVL